VVYFITGRAGSGKTTKAREIAAKCRERGWTPLILDGDEVRQVFDVEGYSERARINHIIHMARIAAIAERQGIVPIIACVSPLRWMRDAAREHFKVCETVYVDGGTLWTGTEYEEPDETEIGCPLSYRTNTA